MKAAIAGTWLSIAAVAALAPSALADPSTPRYRYSGDRSDYGVPDCLNDSPVVGRSQCKRFGRWALPPGLPRLQMSVGGSVRVLGAHDLKLDRSAVDRGVAYANTGGTQDLGPQSGSALTFDWRLTGELSRLLYTGIDVSVGSALIDDPAQEQALGITLGEERGMYYAAGAIAGLLLQGGPLVLRGEMVGGARLVEVPFQYRGSEVRSRASVTQGVVEPRLAAEVWLTPWVTLGARVGSDLLRRRDYMAGLYINLYGRAFDDSRGR